MSETIKKLLTVITDKAPGKKPTVKEVTKWAELEKITADELNEAWKQYQSSLSLDEIDCLFIKTLPGIKSFRRAGFAFNEQGYGIAIDALTKKQITALSNEDNLLVEECAIPANEIMVK